MKFEDLTPRAKQNAVTIYLENKYKAQLSQIEQEEVIRLCNYDFNTNGIIIDPF